MNEVDKFFEDIKSDDGKVDDFFQKPTEEVVPPKEEEKEEVDVPKNRRIRRLEEKLQAERESSIALAERLKVLSELKNEAKPSNEIDSDLIRVFGDNDAGKEIARIMGQKLSQVRSDAKDEALRELVSQQAQVQSEQKEYENLISSQLEALEDEHGVDLTSNAPKAVKERRDFLSLVQKLSPKDTDGNPKEYADFDSVWEIYQGGKEKADNSKRKEIASRSMEKSGTNGADKPTVDTDLAYLRSIGIKV